jgi:phosphonate transport system ATP-binding protein
MRDSSMTGRDRGSVPVVQTQGAAVVYPNGVHALSPCTLAIRPGEFVVLLGPSGAGKSSLLRLLNGLVVPTEGVVLTAEGRRLQGSKVLRAHRRQTAMVFQQHHLIGRASVLDNVLTGRLGYRAIWASLLPWSRAEKLIALAAIERVGLLDRALQRADSLSGGQQQRVGIARALVQRPSLLLADEPVASLDPATSERLMSLLQAICRADRVATVVSLHQLDLALRYADRIVALRHGQVLFDGRADELNDSVVRAIYGESAASGDASPLEPERLPLGIDP